MAARNSGAFTQGLASDGNCLYVCQYKGTNLAEVEKLTCAPLASRFSPSSWTATNLNYGTTFNEPAGVAVDGLGNVYVVDFTTDKLYMLSTAGLRWYVIAGSGKPAEQDGTGNLAAFQHPISLAVDQSGILYVADQKGALRRVRYTGGSRTVASNWLVDTLVYAGASQDSQTTAPGTVAGLNSVTCARDGTLYLTELYDIRRLDRTSSASPPPN
jgi:hypothetical protein